MTTVDEFNKITQAMYDNGYVLVRLRDLVIETTDEDGTVHFTPNTELKLPAGKKAFVLSLDDLSYYHSYDGRGIASKIVLDENGKPTCEYVQADGTMVTGAYDCVPLLDQFIEEHPDASYHGAKGMIALTGYDGILGYRTDIAYKTHENLTDDQQAWLDAHPDFNWDDERAEATKVADAIKADGWEFASHTWGHIRIGDASMERIQTDTQKWLEYVAPLVGGTDTIIFAHGQDLADWHDYTTDNEKFNYLSSQGFHFYCNVDSSQYFLQIRDNYVRQGRRNLDGYRLWNDVHGDVNRTSDLFDRRKIALQYEDVHCQILTDEKWLEFVLEQVLSNALKYTRKGKIKIYMDPQSPKTLVIEDTGIGIAPEDLPRVFERGYTGYNGRTDKRSTGIGLYLCRQIMDRLSHTIRIESEMGVGTRVYLGLDTVEL